MRTEKEKILRRQRSKRLSPCRSVPLKGVPKRGERDGGRDCRKRRFPNQRSVGQSFTLLRRSQLPSFPSLFAAAVKSKKKKGGKRLAQSLWGGKGKW